jgi:hypothetical protein
MKSMKWAVSQRSGGTADSEQYLCGMHQTVWCDTGQLRAPRGGGWIGDPVKFNN